MTMRVRPHSYWPIALAVPVAALGIVLARFAVTLPGLYDDLIARFPVLEPPFLEGGVPGVLRVSAFVAGSAAVLLLAGSITAILLRRRWVLWSLHKCFLLVYVLVACHVHVVTRITSLIMAANIPIEGQAPTPQSLFFLRWDFLWPALVVAALAGVLHVLSWRRVVFNLYTGVHDETPAIGDRIVSNILGNGRDPRFRKSALASIGAHGFVIFVLPWFLALFMHVKPYRVPKGSGTPTVGGPAATPIKIIKPKAVKPKPKQKFIVNPHSAISFHIPDLDESQVAKEVEQASELTYKTDRRQTLNMSGKGGAKGRGNGTRIGAGGGTTGGWPDGMENALVRFIRLEYRGSHWDDGMDAASGADINFLRKIHEETGFLCANKGESHSIALLRRYAKGYAPPFVYMTGDGGISLSADEIKTLRDYLTGGGMLFADCASPSWDRAFRALVQALFPSEPLRIIADDDTLFQQPYTFANGAPPLWHHGGNRALGLKYKDRWCIFYHPGDMNDAWKTGASGMSQELAQASMEMGINIAYYAFTHYLELTSKYRK